MQMKKLQNANEKKITKEKTKKPLNQRTFLIFYSPWQ